VGASPDAAAEKIETLSKRGLISLVCNIAAGNVGHSIAERTKQDAESVQREVRANLVPGAILVPSGIYALIRAQNAGCAYMQGT
jgi:intracellular sulfur oxidation DsrE/DsrF family protein